MRTCTKTILEKILPCSSFGGSELLAGVLHQAHRDEAINCLAVDASSGPLSRDLLVLQREFGSHLYTNGLGVDTFRTRI